MATLQKKTWRRGRPRAQQVQRADVPWAMKLPGGRTLAVEIPGRWTAEDRDGSTLLLPDAVRFLDRLQVLFSCLRTPPSPGYITVLREALGMTQAEMARQAGVGKLTVSKWEIGLLRPSATSLQKIEALRQRAIKDGVELAG